MALMRRGFTLDKRICRGCGRYIAAARMKQHRPACAKRKEPSHD